MVLSHQHVQLIRDSWITNIAAWLVCLAVTALLAWRVDVNEFSLHHFYRNRLVRAYLGATHSAATRVTNPFTGFDRFDDLKLARFRTDDYVRAVDPKAETDVLDKSGGPKLYVGPLPIVNATLNLAAGTNLAWQERKAASFSFTPLYCGYEVGSSTSATGEQMPDDIENDRGFRPTCHYGYEVLQGPSIGTAVAI